MSLKAKARQSYKGLPLTVHGMKASLRYYFRFSCVMFNRIRIEISGNLSEPHNKMSKFLLKKVAQEAYIVPRATECSGILGLSRHISKVFYTVRICYKFNRVI